MNMQEGETISKYADQISLIVNNIRNFGEEFTDKQIVEKVLVTLHERFQSKISSRGKSKDLGKLSLGELMSALQAQEQKEDYETGKVHRRSFLYRKAKKESNNSTKRIRASMMEETIVEM